MLHTLKRLIGRSLEATDGEVGRVDDIFFDELFWKLRYLVAATGPWLNRRRVLIPLQVVEPLCDDDRAVYVEVDRNAVQGSPPISSDRPVAREAELQLAKYWNWTPHWVERPLPWHVAHNLPAEADEESKELAERASESVLRSFGEIRGYHIHARDEKVGHIADLVCEDDSWMLPYAVVDTRNWLPAKDVLLPREAIREVSWADRSVRVDLTREQIRNTPPFDASTPITQAEQKRVRAHFGLELSSSPDPGPETRDQD